LSFTVTLALAGVVALLWLLGASRVALAQSGTGVTRVATTGSDTPGCGDQTSPCRTVQYAVDQAQTGVDEIRVAAGTYTGVQGRAAPGGYPNPPASGIITQVVYISKIVTVRGGYIYTNSTSYNWDVSDPEANLTTLDAQGQGRVIFIIGDISPTVVGLRITSGDATGGVAAGGGVLVMSAAGCTSSVPQPPSVTTGCSATLPTEVVGCACPSALLGSAATPSSPTSLTSAAGCIWEKVTPRSAETPSSLTPPS
jgi:hypothetical protein